MTGRVPILFPFPPSRHLRYIDDEEHIPPSMPFTKVFDLSRLAHTLGMPIVQIEELKTRIETKPLYGEEVDLVHPKEEELGGWSTWMMTNPEFFPKTGQTYKDVPVSNGRRCYQLDTYRISASSDTSLARTLFRFLVRSANLTLRPSLPRAYLCAYALHLQAEGRLAVDLAR